MYRVLIVDDEAYVVDWLSSLLESQMEPELDVCRAYSAEEALNWLNRAKIDIVITDICMPEMNGIKLAEKVNQNWPQCKVIMLTAHAEFDYAYESIKNNVISYILKTEEDEGILREVNKAICLLDKELTNLQLLDDMQEKIKKSTSELEKEILLGILQSEKGGSEELWEQLESIGVNIVPDRRFLLIIGRTESNRTDKNIVKRYRQLSAIKKIAEHYFKKHLHYYPVEYEVNRIAWIIQPNSKEVDQEDDTVSTIDSSQTIIFTKGMLETIQQSCMETLGIAISFVIHHELIEAYQLSEKFQDLNNLMNLHGTDKAGFVISDNNLKGSVSEEEYFPDASFDIKIIHNINDKLKSCLDNARQDEFMTELDGICKELEKCKSWHSHIANENYYSVAIAIIGHINQRKISSKIAFKIGMHELFNPHSTGSWSNAASYLRRLSKVVFEIQEEFEGDLSNNTIRFLKNYINEHICEDISLVKLSEVTGYNASYISRFFKESTGNTLNDYISRRKLNKIKELMLKDDLNISDIALKAGFGSRTYFNRFMKKVSGMSPQEFREHIRHG